MPASFRTFARSSETAAPIVAEPPFAAEPSALTVALAPPLLRRLTRPPIEVTLTLPAPPPTSVRVVIVIIAKTIAAATLTDDPLPPSAVPSFGVLAALESVDLALPRFSWSSAFWLVSLLDPSLPLPPSPPEPFELAVAAAVEADEPLATSEMSPVAMTLRPICESTRW